jgi:hypothetical protein
MTELRSAGLDVLKSRRAIPGYLLILWKFIDFLSTVDFIAALPQRVTGSSAWVWLTSQTVSSWLAVFGIVYLIVLVRFPKSSAPAPSRQPTEVQLPEPVRVHSVSLTPSKPWTQSEAKTLAGEIARFVDVYRKVPLTIPTQNPLRQRALRVTEAIAAYEVQYARRVETLYRESYWTSAFKSPDETTDLLGRLAAGPPCAPTTLNEIAGIGREIEALARSRD